MLGQYMASEDGIHLGYKDGECSFQQSDFGRKLCEFPPIERA